MAVGLFIPRQFQRPAATPLNMAHPVTAGIMGYWHDTRSCVPGVNNATASVVTVIDSNVGTVVNNTTSGGTNVDATTDVSLDLVAGTLSGWIVPTTAYNSNTERGVMGVNNTADAVPECTIQVYTDNKFYAGWYVGGVDYRVSVSTTTQTWTQNVPMHLVLTYDTTKDTRLYVNGELIGTATTPPVTTTLSNKFRWMTRGYSVGAKLLGSMYDVGLWRRALAPDEIAYLFDPRTRWALYGKH